MLYYVYYLIDPISSQIRYVGISSCPKGRSRKHIIDNSDTHKCRWIKELQTHGVVPILRIACVVESDLEAKRIEVALIAVLPNLTNSTQGGDGVTNPTAEVRAKQGAAHRGKVISVEQRSKISAALKGKKLSLETRLKMSIAGKGRKHSSETCEKRSKSLMGRISPMKGRKFTEEHRANLSQSQKGKPSPLRGRPSGKKGVPWSSQRREAQLKRNNESGA